jgi:hypothetical protein
VKDKLSDAVYFAMLLVTTFALVAFWVERAPWAIFILWFVFSVCLAIGIGRSINRSRRRAALMASLRPPPPEVCEHDPIAGTKRCARCGAGLTGGEE